jgi:uncharacterized protein YdbL (DUF1318 family)
MKRAILVLLLGVFFGLGCARLRVEAPKEPIKVDISMRLDVYQHVQKDIDAIEGIVSGDNKPVEPTGGQSLLNYFVSCAWAQEELSAPVKGAALRRKTRLSELTTLQLGAIVGENKSGLVEIRNKGAADAAVEQLVNAENADRMVIYKSLAEKNNTSLESIQQAYAQRLQKSAPRGTPIEVLNTTTNSYEWQVK